MRFVVSLVLLGFLVSCADLSDNKQLHHLQGQTMGTVYNLSLVLDSDVGLSHVEAIHGRVKGRLALLDGLLSTYKSDSEVSVFNDTAPGESMLISRITRELIAASIKVHDISGGAFDVTVGPLVDLWGFGGGSSSGNERPSDEQIFAKKQLVGTDALTLVDNRLSKSKWVRVDLSAIAKGYAVDSVGKVLDEAGVSDYLIEIGGEVLTKGHSIRNTLWVLGIESPDNQGRNVYTKVRFGNGAMATSGDYRNYFETSEGHFSHTIDPTTGWPVKHLLASVSVIAESCMQADALATALMVMGEQKGLEFAQAHDISAFFIYRGADGLITKQTSSFDAYLQ